MKFAELHKLSEETQSDAQLLIQLIEEVSHPSLTRIINATPEKEKVMGWAVELFRRTRNDKEANDLQRALELASGIAEQLGRINSRVSPRNKEVLGLLAPIGDDIEVTIKVAELPFNPNFLSQLETLDVVISNLILLRQAVLDPEIEKDFGFENELQPVLVRSAFKRLGFISR